MGRIKRTGGSLPLSPPHLPSRHADKAENEAKSLHMTIATDGSLAAFYTAPKVKMQNLNELNRRSSRIFYCSWP